MGILTVTWAAGRGHSLVVSILLNLGANVDSLNTELETPLMKACAAGHAGTAELLLDRGADGNAQDIVRETPLMKAVAEGRTATAELLIKEGLTSVHRTIQATLL